LECVQGPFNCEAAVWFLELWVLGTFRVFGFAREKDNMKDGSGVYYETTLQNSETLESLQFWFWRFWVLGL
jgi:hypothetical protein